ncbi:MAG: hypothetical protein HYX69_13110 [Planctomycetia bacterium]|nr:hypothetical protein [Planctomycetia bacterium]
MGLILLARQAPAQTAAASAADGRTEASEGATPLTKFDIPARGEPSPALKYRLLPSFLELRPGNAAVVYTKITGGLEFRNSKEWGDIDEKISDWMSAPLDQIPREEARKALDHYSYHLDQVAAAARMETCDWQLPIRDERPWAIRLPEVQSARTIARAVALRARLEIAEGKYDDALRTLQTGFALGRHVAQGRTLINGLVGVAICAIMFEQVETLIRQPDAPNLYWAIMAMPRPLIDLRPGYDAEMHFVDFAFPKLQDPAAARFSAEEWREMLDKIGNILAELGEPPGRPDALVGPALAVKVYPQAKARLIASGRPADEVERMPVAQVVVLSIMEDYRRVHDEVFKWMFVPFWQRQPGEEAAEEAIRHARDNMEGFPLIEVLPAARAASMAQARIERRVAALAAVEAIRIYAAGHGGKVPARLTDITEAPVMIDPVTGQPFGYSAVERTATITAPAPAGMDRQYHAIHYEVTIKP